MSGHTQGVARIGDGELDEECVVHVGERQVGEFYADGEVQTEEDQVNAARFVKVWNAYPKLVERLQEGPAHKACALLLEWVKQGENGMPNPDTLADAVTFARLASRDREALLRHLGEAS